MPQNVTHSTKMLPRKQQSRRRPPTPDGFALSPIRAVFLDSNRWVVEPAVKRLKSSPRSHSSVSRGDGQYDEERLAPR